MDKVQRELKREQKIEKKYGVLAVRRLLDKYPNEEASNQYEFYKSVGQNIFFSAVLVCLWIIVWAGGLIAYELNGSKSMLVFFVIGGIETMYYLQDINRLRDKRANILWRIMTALDQEMFLKGLKKAFGVDEDRNNDEVDNH